MEPTPDTHSHSHEPHACPMWILLAVFVALLVLTVVTVYTATQVDLGPYNLLLAMAIALIKGALVALFFMHLWWDSLFNAIALIAGLGFLAVFIAFSIVDTYQYEPSVMPLREVLTPAKIRATSIHEASPHEPARQGQPPMPEVEAHRPEPASGDRQRPVRSQTDRPAQQPTTP